MSTSPLVLIADDEPLLLKMLTKVLKRMGNQVIAVSDGSSAVDAFMVQPEEFDLVVLDMNMPIMDGAEAFHAISAQSSRTPVLISSGDSRDEVLKRLKIEPAGIISKPYNLNELRTALHEFLPR